MTQLVSQQRHMVMSPSCVLPSCSQTGSPSEVEFSQQWEATQSEPTYYLI